MQTPSEDEKEVIELLQERLDAAQRMLEQECRAREQVQRQLEDAQTEITALRERLAEPHTDNE